MIDRRLTVCMKSWPRTSDRIECFRRTLQSFFENAIHPGTRLEFRVSTETAGVPERRSKEFLNACSHHGAEIVPRFGRPSVAANSNAALALAWSDPFLNLQDDFLLRYPLDLEAALDFMDRRPEVHCLRLLCQSQTVYDEIDGDFGIVSPSNIWYYADQPAIRRKSMAELVGPYDETLATSQAEYRYSRRLAERGGVVAGMLRSPFEHIGAKPVDRNPLPLPKSHQSEAT